MTLPTDFSPPLTWSDTITRPDGRRYRISGRDRLVRIDYEGTTIARLVFRNDRAWVDQETGDRYPHYSTLALVAIRRHEAAS